MLRHQTAVAVPPGALRAALGWADWPARLQRLDGALTAHLPAGAELWLDGLHNPAAARAIAEFFRTHAPADRPFHMILGLLENKDPVGVLQPFAGRVTTLQTVPVPGHAHHTPAALAELAAQAGIPASPADTVAGALTRIAADAGTSRPIVLIGGSLYLAGRVLVEDGSIPE